MHWGAQPADWVHFDLVLGLTSELLPIVADTTKQIHPSSSLKLLGKTPSVLTEPGGSYARGISDWTKRVTTAGEVKAWAKEPTYSLALQCRAIRAFDIDCPTRGEEFAMVIETELGFALPTRARSNTGKRLLAFRLEGEHRKQVIKTNDGAIEFLGNGQQFVACGTHTSGARYEWVGGLPNEFPLLTEAQFTRVMAALRKGYEIEAPAKASKGRALVLAEGVNQDAVAQFLLTENWVLGRRPDGSFNIRCPNADQHTSESSDSATVYFLPHTNGYATGQFKCEHAHCNGLPQETFLNLIGFTASMFDDLTVVEPDEPIEAVEEDDDGPLPVFAKNKGGRYISNLNNLRMALLKRQCCGNRQRYDVFLDQRQIQLPNRTWRVMVEGDEQRMRWHLETRGNFAKVPASDLDDALKANLEVAEVDSAQDWLNAQRWDGVPRVERFLETHWGTNDGPYARAVGRYIWTALAGRTLSPGAQADMVPVMIGAQGVGKTRGIKAMAWEPEHYGEVRFDMEEDKWHRAFRGKTVLEIGELRGLGTRDQEEIKARVTRTREEWTPKYVEHNTRYDRRAILFGSTNKREFLADSTGERRWLPVDVARVDVPAIARDCAQLWAEGAELYRRRGVDWRDAEILAREQHAEHKAELPYFGLVSDWLESFEFGDDLVGPSRGEKPFTTDQVMTAIGIHLSQLTNNAIRGRVKECLERLGFREVRLGRGKGERGRVWRNSQETTSESSQELASSTW